MSQGEATQSFARHAEIRGDQAFRNAPQSFRVQRRELLVTLESVLVEQGQYPLLQSRETETGFDKEKMFHFVNRAANRGAVVKGEREQFGVCDTINADGGIGARKKRPKVADPPILDGELICRRKKSFIRSNRKTPNVGV